MSTKPPDEPATLEALRAEIQENTRLTRGIANTLLELSQHVAHIVDAVNTQGAAAFRMRQALMGAGRTLVSAGQGVLDEDLLLGGNGHGNES